MNEIKNGFEIERRFLVANMPNLDNFPSKNIIQYYLNDKVTRLRRMDNEYLLTQKSGSGLSRTEIEYQITKEHFDKLKLGATSFIMKTRYFIPLYDDLVAELDVFKGKHLGIVICEVEFPSVQSANDFIVPSWLGKDITLEKNLSNKNMSKNPEKALKLFNSLIS
ncbi:MAG: adenylate cyclase [Clostridia bacterium]|nr:adenylate cyclase [Clostridia bacterium]